MSWKLDKNRPVCPQITEQICVKIASGEFGAGQKLPSVREVAVAAGVNPNTVQKSFEQLEQSGVIYSVRGSGNFVSEDITIAKQSANEIITNKTANYIEEMKTLGLDNAQILKYIEELIK